ncbi:hypothetical protein SERLA73DRAFT_176637 [Serpula lacrymans var. lacrymans S7.3]|uniref:Tetratricopeptide repeat protein 39B n=2 Tax=Serpula lacrymans var. lacrymans TaxID=341189 RepID=F8PND6_SERL3|nr:uncharacterized protein SERLADRAFT_459759 [Serpula lacrymans var. lacrymans S7.9]EGO03118.1 hypothetical protein SERLA73DRAFT_176637 [Serpula lacrymans var. lacrymans S7.3]EGO28885.1 hypothetical protein SERLADRAFT_459759 [Serpula lacrymans var. lacrymans S7.9]
MYFATGYGLIQCVKGLMSFEDKDLLAAIGHTRHGNAVASQHRKRQASLTTRLAGYVVSSLNTSGVGWIKDMTPVERHAELVYAESLFEKSLLGVVYSGDWLAFIKEVLNMRTTMNIYRQLGKFLDAVDAEAQARGEGSEDKSIDADFRSGVYLGLGMSNLILSMMPGKLLTLVELFGYKGDRHLGLEVLQRAGGWTKDSSTPSVSWEGEGVRRSICDMCLLIFHLVLSSFTFDGVDIMMAQKILDWNLKRYSNGVFFLFGAGRLALCRSQPSRAIEYYTKATQSQSQYRNLYHISWWEIAVSNFSLWDVRASLTCWRDLEAEATWSKACYTYGMAACLVALGEQQEATKHMCRVPGLRQKIAGKSIPLEKFVARKARKFQQQGGRLALPALELAYVFQAISHAPKKVIISKMLPEIEKLLLKLKEHEKAPAKYEQGHGYWDDLCLARFLEGVCLRYVAYPDPDAVLDPREEAGISTENARIRAVAALESVFSNGHKVELDHHLIYHAHFEYGRLLARSGDIDGARTQFDLILSGKPLEVLSGRKGKYSLENSLHLRTHAAQEALLHNRSL